MAEDLTKKDLTPAERKDRVKLFIKSFEGGVKPHTKRLEVKGKDAEYSYRLVKNKPENIDYRKQMGYTLVGADEVESTSMEQADGRTVIAGVYVLMKRDRLIHDAHRDFLKRKSAERAGAPRKSFKAKARSLGVESVDESRSRYGSLGSMLEEDSRADKDE